MIFSGLVLVAVSAKSQYEYLATLDYNNIAVKRVGNIPGISYITSDNSAYDQNGKRLFFQGATKSSGPWAIFTIDAPSGVVLNSVLCPPGLPSAQIRGLQYDNADNILYAIELDGPDAIFSSIDPVTGNVHVIKKIPGFLYYTQSTYDQKDHWYIVSNGKGLIILDAHTGNILFNYPALILTDIFFDNLNGALFGIAYASLPYQFVSVIPSTGATNFITNLPALTLPVLNAYTIDEKAGKYIFLGSVQDVDGPSNYLYVLDINTGAILSKQSYPYAQGTAISTAQNLIEYSFDNQTGTLYALNWYPKLIDEVPPVAIEASPNPGCVGDTVKFTAIPGPGLTNPTYQWQLNHKNVGDNTTFYQNNALVTGDSVYCIMVNHPPNLPSPPDTSNIIGIRINPVIHSSVVINTPATIVCTGEPAVFNATPVTTGDSLNYQWQVNGTDAGDGSATFMSGTLSDNDVVSCVLTSRSPCSMPAISNSIVMRVNESPEVYAGNDTVIAAGKSVKLNPSVKGTIASYVWSPAEFLDDSLVASPEFTAGRTTNIKLLVTATNGCTATGKLAIVVYTPLHMPNTFTPNGDGLNDVFRIPPSMPQKIKQFAIFNRWGQAVFKTTDGGQGWDGIFNNQKQPSGTYVWQIEYQDLLSHNTTIASGTVVLVR
jgi:gliding motility-associated-like protein